MYIAPNDFVGPEARAGQLLNLDSYLSDNLDNISQAAIDQMKYDGVLYGVPESFKTVAMYYNKSLVPTPPTTMAELSDLVAGENKLAASAPGGGYFLYGFWNPFGGQIMDENGKCIADQGGVDTAMQYLLDLIPCKFCNLFYRVSILQ
jgi:arabinogalactan oligomer/maltooligosaccharide transport system substrate-binding protein